MNLKNVNITEKQKRLIIINLVMLFVATGLILADFWALNLWSKWNDVTIQSPIKTQIPIVITKLENEREPTILSPFVVKAKEIEPLTQEDKTNIVYEAGLGSIIEKVRTLESGKGEFPSGHHKFCESLGKSNEFGYFSGGNKHFCFNNFEDSVKEVTSWYETQLTQMPLDVALCYYNTGIMMAECEYSQNFHKL